MSTGLGEQGKAHDTLLPFLIALSHLLSSGKGSINIHTRASINSNGAYTYHTVVND